MWALWKAESVVAMYSLVMSLGGGKFASQRQVSNL